MVEFSFYSSFFFDSKFFIVCFKALNSVWNLNDRTSCVSRLRHRYRRKRNFWVLSILVEQQKKSDWSWRPQRKTEEAFQQHETKYGSVSKLFNQFERENSNSSKFFSRSLGKYEAEAVLIYILPGFMFAFMEIFIGNKSLLCFPARVRNVCSVDVALRGEGATNGTE